jgi:putative ABC transport system permease protein
VLFVVFRALARGLVSLFSRYETRLPLALRLSLAEIAARKETAVLSMALAGLSLFLTCLVQFVKDDLLTPLGDTSVRGKPNLYLVDVQPSQKAGVEAALKERNGGGAVYASPMVRARLVRVNADETNAAQGEASSGGEVMGGPPQEGLARSPEEEAARSRRREQNLTYRHSLGDGERVLERVEGAPPAPEGHIWDPAGGARAEVSIEREFAGRARIALGDELTFDVQGIPVKARVTSLRSVTWQNWRPNFFMVVHPSLLSDAPQMNLVATNVAAAEDRRALTRELAGSFPNVSVLDAAAIVKRVAELSTGVAEATRFLATLLLGASLLVLAAGLVSTRRTRLRHYAVIRSLGGKNGLLSASLVLEFLWLAGVSGALGVVAAAVVARVFSETFLDLDASLSLAPALYLFAGYLVVNVVVGWLSCASVLRRKPSEVLREGI